MALSRVSACRGSLGTNLGICDDDGTTKEETRVATPTGDARNEGLSKVSRLTRRTLVGGLVVAGVLAGVAAKSVPGHGGTASRNDSSTGIQPGAGEDAGKPGASTGGLRPPDGAPGQGFDPGFGGGGGQVTSGGS